MTWSFRGDYLKNLRIIEPALDYISRSIFLKKTSVSMPRDCVFVYACCGIHALHPVDFSPAKSLSHQSLPIP